MSESMDYTARFVTAASPDKVFEALTTLDGLSAWWTPATGDPTTGGVITFTFSPGNVAVMHVDQADRSGIRWTNTECMVADWVGTSQHFDLEALPDGGTAVDFRHVGLTPQLECYSDCLSGWNHFIGSLQAYVETGAGHPSGSGEDTARRKVRAAAGAA